MNFDGDALFAGRPELRLMQGEPNSYPSPARLMRISGTVVLNIAFAEDRTVRRVEVVKGRPLVIDPTKSSVQKWRFEPRFGKPRGFELTLKFELPDIAPNKVQILVEQPFHIVVMAAPPTVTESSTRI